MMKAVILSGGLGVRLRPLTNKIPKTMVNIDDKTLLWHHIYNLKKHGIKDVWIALQYLPQIVQDYFGDGSNYGIKIKYSIEKHPLGTAGALNNPDSEIKKDIQKESFIVIYGDNLTNYNLSKLISLHKKSTPILTVGLYESQEPWTMGVIEADKDGKIIRFVEKPPKEEIVTNTVSAGIIVCEPEIFNYIPAGFSDFGFDIFPKLISLNKELYAFSTHSYVQDIGTPDRLTKARKDYKTGKVKI